MKKTPLILIADDDDDVLRALEFHLRRWGCETGTARDKATLLRLIAAETPTAVLLDARLGEHDGVEVLRSLQAARPSLHVIMIAAFATVDSAVCAMKQGAFDYLTKPLDLHRIKSLIDECVQFRIKPSLERLPPPGAEGSQPAAVAASPALIGRSGAIHRVRALAAAVAPTDASVLILGESGTGKEVVARSLHEQSRRSAHPFLALNMAALPRELVESSLFGHEKGAFTGADNARVGSVEAANKGTLFLDEIGEMDPTLQAKLLRFLQERTYHRVGSSGTRAVDVRIVAATNRDPAEQMRQGQLREDLYYRLNVVPIVLPPLRDRIEDLEPLADHFLARSAARLGKPARTLSRETLELFRHYPWPGNVRELENLIERLVIFSDGPEIGREMVPEEITREPHAATSPTRDAARDWALRPMDRIEKQAIQDALTGASGNVRVAARRLGIGQATVYRKIKRYGINLSEGRL